MRLTTLAVLILTATRSQLVQADKPEGLTSQPSQTDSALTAETRRVFQAITENTIKAAREIPEASYTFTPVTGVRSFGELIAHIANAQSTRRSQNTDNRPYIFA
jgi:hypothetical protein